MLDSFYPMKKTLMRTLAPIRMRLYLWSSAVLVAVAAVAFVGFMEVSPAGAEELPEVPFCRPRPVVTAASPRPADVSPAPRVPNEAAPVAFIPPSPPLSCEEIARLADRYASLYGVPDLAGSMARVIHMESRGYAQVRSRDGRYLGLCQFMPNTFRANVRAMKALGLLDAADTYSPLNPDHAVRVMAWMWSRGLHDQWGPARHMALASARPDIR